MSHCDLGIWRMNLKIHWGNARGTAYIPAKFRRNSLKNKRENGIQLIWNGWIAIFYFVTLTFELRTSKCKQLLIDQIWDRSDEKRQRNRIAQVGPIFKDCLLVTVTFVRWPCKCKCILYWQMSIHQPNVNKIGWKWKRNRDFRFSYFVSMWPWPLTFASKNVYSSTTSHYLSSGQIWDRSDNKWQINRVAQVAVKKKNKMKKKTERKQKGLPTYVSDNTIKINPFFVAKRVCIIIVLLLPCWRLKWIICEYLCTTHGII